jgi:hypothetical protein
MMMRVSVHRVHLCEHTAHMHVRAHARTHDYRVRLRTVPACLQSSQQAAPSRRCGTRTCSLVGATQCNLCNPHHYNEQAELQLELR